MKRTKNRKIIPISNAYRHYRRPYPNAADPGYFIDRLIDGTLAVVTAMGGMTILFFLITM